MHVLIGEVNGKTITLISPPLPAVSGQLLYMNNSA